MKGNLVTDNLVLIIAGAIAATVSFIIYTYINGGIHIDFSRLMGLSTETLAGAVIPAGARKMKYDGISGVREMKRTFFLSRGDQK